MSDTWLSPAGLLSSAAQVDIGTVCGDWDGPRRCCATPVTVRRLPGRAASHFTARLEIDADGAPRAYHPDNAGAYDWLANVSPDDLHGIQGQDGIGPAPGFYVSATSLCDPAFPENDTRRYVDAAAIPYIVLDPRTYPRLDGAPVTPGTLAFVVETRTGGTSGAIYADAGRAVGEGSIALALALGLDPFSARHPPKVTGFEVACFFYLLFHGVHVAPPWPVDVIQREAAEAFATWGGEAQLRALVPGLPPLLSPVAPVEPGAGS